MPASAMDVPPGTAKATGFLTGKEIPMFPPQRFSKEEGSDIAEYAVTTAMILLMVIGIIRLMGGNIAVVFYQVSQSFGSIHAN
ncbi:MAG TPA: hypothetical protein VF753_11660 [Terriglobales bacterium]